MLEKVNTIMPNYVSRFYDRQNELRGIFSVSHVEELEASQSVVYDRVIYQYLKQHQAGKIVEIACGPGIFMRYLNRKKFTEAIGVEMSEQYINLCNEQNFKVVKADALEWLTSQPKSSIDVIVAIDFIEHLDKENFVNFLDLVYLALAPNGFFIARGPCGNSPYFGLNFFNDITHETVFTTTALSALMKICDLELVTVIDEYPANILRGRWWRVPLSRLVRFLMRKSIYWFTGHYITNLSPDVWIVCKPLNKIESK